jgi:hypothetical protein
MDRFLRKTVPVEVRPGERDVYERMTRLRTSRVLLPSIR